MKFKTRESSNSRRRTVPNRDSNRFIGRINYGRNRSAYVISPHSGERIIIPSRHTGLSLDGDEVAVCVLPPRRTADPNALAAGRVLEILKRTTDTVVGDLHSAGDGFYVQPIRHSATVRISVEKPGTAKPGDRVVVHLTPTRRLESQCRGVITEVLGRPNDPTGDALTIMRSYGLSEKFLPEVVQQADSRRTAIFDIGARLDLRRTTVFTIDPETAKDHDDAVSLKKLPGSRWLLGVHIADVAHFVAPGSIVDEEAFERGTSVYFPDRVVPMLPEALSNDLCSLRENEDRLTLSVLITLDDESNVLKVEFRESIIRVRFRLSYEEASQILSSPSGSSCPDRKLTARHVAMLQQMGRLAQGLRSDRFRNGSLNLSLADVKVITDENDLIKEIQPVQNDHAHQLIEEFMLLANELVCKHLCDAEWDVMYRIHEPPDPERISELANDLRAFKIDVGNLGERSGLCRLLDRIATSPQSHVISTMILRSLKRAEYATKKLGHFGLAKEFYCHFTSPIRRYPDLIIHRLLKARIASAPEPYTSERLNEVAQHCTEREANASDAERDLINMKIMRFFSGQIQSGKVRQYDAVVVDIKRSGLVIDLPEIHVFGMVPNRLLTGRSASGSRGRRGRESRHPKSRYKVGETIRVVIHSVDIERKFIDFALVA